MRKIKYKAWSECCQDFLNITGFECTDGEITGIFHDGDYVGYDKEDVSLLQFTGLYDKNGIELYEGYIVSAKGYFDGYKYNVCGYDYDFIAEVKWDDIELIYTCNGYNLSDLDNLEVLGNIYQNPDLLK